MTISASGQITIPEAIQERYHLTPGTEVEFAPNDRGELTVRATPSPTRQESLTSWLQASKGLASHLGLRTDDILQATRSEI